MSPAKPDIVDALIVGAGPAGLSAALGLCRQRRTVVLFDSGVYRNAIASHMHNVPTWDHKAPSDFRAAALRELVDGRYKTVQHVRAQVNSVEKDQGDDSHSHFAAHDSNGKVWRGKKLLIASGVTDIMPDIPGFESAWKNSNIYHCLFCHGFEKSGATSAGVLAVENMVPPMSAHFAKMSTPFAQRVVVYTNASDPVRDALVPLVQNVSNVEIDHRRIKKIIAGTNGAEPAIELEGGSGSGSSEIVQHAFFAHQPAVSPNVAFATSLDLKLSESGRELAVSAPFYETNVKGCFAAGDVATIFRSVSGALAAGTAIAGGVVAQL